MNASKFWFAGVSGAWIAVIAQQEGAWSALSVKAVVRTGAHISVTAGTIGRCMDAPEIRVARVYCTSLGVITV